MKRFGMVKLVQVQTRSLKVGERPNQTYDPTPITAVDHLTLARRGVVGYAADESRLDDVHSIEHPQSKYRSDNGISIGLTAHYDRMRQRFGDHLSDGIAGENIIITCERGYTLDDLSGGLVFVSAATGQQTEVKVIGFVTPCEPFAQFAAGRKLSGSELQDALKFLHLGTRGFFIVPVEAGNAVVRAGDAVFSV